MTTPTTAVASPWISAAPAAAYTDGRPGSVPMRPLAMGEILDGAMALLRQYPAPTLGLGAIVMAIQMALTVPVQWLGQSFTFSLIDTTDGGGFDPITALLGLSLTTMITSIIATACVGVVTGFAAAVVGDTALGREVTLGNVWRHVRPRLWALVGLSLLIGFAQVIGLLALGVGRLFVTGVLAVVIPVLILERAGVFRAIKRSWNLTIGDFLRVLGIRMLAIVIAWVLSVVLALPFLAAGEYVLLSGGAVPSPSRSLIGVFLLALGTMSGDILTAPFLGCVDGLLYLDRRMRSEGLDIELQHRGRSAAAVRTVA